jgi:lysophospholipase L1-like esterase
MFKALSLVLPLLFGMILAACGGEGGGGNTDSPGSLPIVSTLAATSITPTSAILNGTAIPNGLPTRSWFEYCTDSALATFTSSPKQDAGNGLTGQAANMTWNGLMWGAIRSFPTGELFVAVGDSITAGEYDDDPSDGMGFEPVLQNLLSTARGYPIAIVKAGVGGVHSAYGAANIATTLSDNPQAKYYLVLYGSNDAFIPADPSGLGLAPGDDGYNGSYKHNMQQIISNIVAAGKLPYLAKVPYTTRPSQSLQSIGEYNQVIVEPVAANGISITSPDFYGYFLAHQGELIDGLHPSGVGYQSMATLWLSALP